MKILFIINSRAQWAKSLEAEYKKLGKDVTVIAATCEDALVTFLCDEPEVVVIAEFDKDQDRIEFWRSKVNAVHGELMSVASPDHLIIKTGFIPYNSPDLASPLGNLDPMSLYRMVTTLKQRG